MFNPMYKKSRLLFGNPESRVAIVSLWTKPQKIAEKVSQDKYCLIGQLFSAERGLDFMFRNLMANPQITNLVITGTDFSKSGVVLKDFFVWIQEISVFLLNAQKVQNAQKQGKFV